MYALLLNALSGISDVNTTLLIAKHFPVAAVVFPIASNASVVFQTLSSKSAISAIPPALSATGLMSTQRDTKSRKYAYRRNRNSVLSAKCIAP